MKIFIRHAHRPELLGSFLALVLVACGGHTAPNDATAAANSSAVAPAASTEPAAPASAEAAPAVANASPGPAKPAAVEAGPESATRNLSDRLFAPTIAYMLNYSESGARKRVADACASKTGGDPAANAACMEKERSKLVSDVLVFEKKDKKTSFTIYKRTGNALAEVSKAQVDVGKDTPDRIEFKITNEKGSRQLFAGRKQIVISSASDSSITVDDPQLGQLVYDARIGLINPGTAQ